MDSYTAYAGSLMGYSVTHPRESDVSPIVAMGRRMVAESIYAGLDYDEAKCIAFVRNAMTNPEMFFRVILNGDDPVGLFIGFLDVSFFGNDCIACDRFLFLDREHRGAGCFHSLKSIFDEYREWAVACDAKLIWLSSSSGLEIEKTSALFRGVGFPQVGTVHVVKSHVL